MGKGRDDGEEKSSERNRFAGRNRRTQSRTAVHGRSDAGGETEKGIVTTSFCTNSTRNLVEFVQKLVTFLCKANEYSEADFAAPFLIEGNNQKVRMRIRGSLEIKIELGIKDH